MTSPIDKAQGRDSLGFDQSRYPTTTTQVTSSGPQEPKTQLARVIDALRDRWVCATAFHDGSFDGGRPIWRYGARLHEARQRGIWVERRPCTQHPTHEAPIYEWRIPPTDIEQLDMFGGDQL